VQFDQATVTALLNTLTARSVAGQFALTTRAALVSDPNYLDHPIAPKLRSRSSSYTQRSVISWWAVYRSPVSTVYNPDGVTVAYQTGGVQRAFGNPPGQTPTMATLQWVETLVVDTSSLLVAQGLLLDWALTQFNMHDQRMKSIGMVPQLHP
jgi:hypothetical protein